MTEQTTALAEARKPVETGLVLHGLLTNRHDRLSSALEGTGLSADRFIEGVVQTVAKNADLLKCTRESVLLACLESAQIGLEPTGILNQAWLVPYKTTARLMIGYGGYITLLDRSRSYDFIEAVLVYENDEFWYERGTNPQIHHVPAADGQRGHFGHKNGGGYWVAWKKGSSRPQWDVMSWDELQKRRATSKRAEEDMWRAWPEEMYRKTILRWGMKQMPLTPIVQRAFAYENESMDLPDDRPAPSAASGRRESLLDRIANGSQPDATDSASDPEQVPEAQNEGEPPEKAAPSLPKGCTCEPGPNEGERVINADCPVHKGK